MYCTWLAENTGHKKLPQNHHLGTILVLLLSSNRQHLSSDDCLQDKRKDYQNWSVLCCVGQLYTMIRLHTWAVSTVDCWFWFAPGWRLWTNSKDLWNNVHNFEAWRWCWQTNESTLYCLQCFYTAG